jgi:hypothetical protein
LTDGNDHTTLFAYDSKGRLSLLRYPLATADQGYDTVRFTLYDDAGRLLRRIDGATSSPTTTTTPARAIC